MPRPRLPYLRHERNRHGNRVWYFRRGNGPRIRIRGDWGSDEFLRSYNLALAGGVPARTTEGQKGTLGWLIASYRKAADWTTLAPTTRSQRNTLFAGVLAASDVQLSAITRTKIIEGRDRRSATPFLANNWLKAMRGLFRWAVEMDLVDTDPTIAVRALKTKTEGFHVWTEEEVRIYEDRWPIGTRERLALDLLLYTGLRRGDAVRLGREHVWGDVFRIRMEKTGGEIIAPVLLPLKHSLLASQEGERTFLCTLDGKPWNKFSFGNWFKKACRAAGVPGSAHGLRKAGATRAAENGATTAQLRAMFGWENDAMPAHYTRKADRARMASEAMSKLERRGAAGSVETLTTTMGKCGEDQMKNAVDFVDKNE